MGTSSLSSSPLQNLVSSFVFESRKQVFTAIRSRRACPYLVRYTALRIALTTYS